jgi:flagellar biosynthetic protein FliS
MRGNHRNWDGPGMYRAVQGIGAMPEEFMKMGLDSAQVLLLRAEAAIDAGDRPEKAKALSSAFNIVEFMLGLTGVEGGALSDSLASVYQYALAAILRGNTADDKEAVASARVALAELAAAWRRIYPDDIAASEDSMFANGRGADA